jgi:hypothetical protein
MKVKTSIVMETMYKYTDLILDEICKECNCAGGGMGPNTKIISDDEETADGEDVEDVEDIDEQFNLAVAMKDPKILSLARKLVSQSGGKFDLKDAVIRVARYGGKTGAMI